jgi:hypothetical protein
LGKRRERSMYRTQIRDQGSDGLGEVERLCSMRGALGGDLLVYFDQKLFGDLDLSRDEEISGGDERVN